MNRDEVYQSLYQNSTVYRPPQENESILVEVATGCSWHQCTFCDFARDPFALLPLETIRANVETLAQLAPQGHRVFLLGQNALVRSTQELLEIFGYLHHYLPQVQEISMYARADDILRKSPQELQELRQMGLSDLHVGVESGSDTVLLQSQKGETAMQLLQAFQRLDAAGIGYFVTSILGLGGKQLWKAHAIETARLYNRIHPKQIWVLALRLFPATPLHKAASRGEFEPLTPRELLLEERLLLESLEVETFFMDTTVMNKYTIAGPLPTGKAGLIQAINRLLTDEDFDTLVQAAQSPPSGAPLS